MSIYDFMTLPFWSDAKIAEESHHLSLSMLERVLSDTTAPTTKGSIILLPTPDEIVASLPDSHLIEDNLERDEGVSTRAVSAPTMLLRKRLGAPPSIAVVSASEPSYVGTLAPTSTFGRVFPLELLLLVVVLGSPGLSTATRSEEIDLTLFPLAPGPYHMPYSYEGVSSPLYTKKEWNEPHASKCSISCKDILKDLNVCRKALDRTTTPAKLKRTESLLPLELSNRVNVLSALLVSYGYELNSHYASLVSSKAHLQEKFDKKKGDVKLLHLERLLSSDELHAALARVTSLGINYGVESGLRMGRTNVELEATIQKVFNFHVGAKANFAKALDDFPTTLFPFLSKIVAASEGSLSDDAQILSDKFVLSATSVAAAPSNVNEALKRVPL
uniref:Uncharacterized protein n=1 Tax=Tanacetum cinerariifolium TaxID=118510 RepID=A0A6L2M0M9_TANCI|nr:hypothetical protein [Tanacetum cinerariifolium]